MAIIAGIRVIVPVLAPGGVEKEVSVLINADVDRDITDILEVAEAWGAANVGITVCDKCRDCQIGRAYVAQISGIPWDNAIITM